jgi:hypothetical protein
VGNRGVSVPDSDSEHFIRQDVRDSTVEEYFDDVVARDARVSQLRGLDRSPMAYYAHTTRVGVTEAYAVRWVEPRGQ